MKLTFELLIEHAVDAVTSEQYVNQNSFLSNEERRNEIVTRYRGLRRESYLRFTNASLAGWPASPSISGEVEINNTLRRITCSITPPVGENLATFAIPTYRPEGLDSTAPDVEGYPNPIMLRGYTFVGGIPPLSDEVQIRYRLSLTDPWQMLRSEEDQVFVDANTFVQFNIRLGTFDVDGNPVGPPSQAISISQLIIFADIV